MSNIPHCCLPQESGPCLSPNVAVHPLRPATDRRLGKPLPYQPANQTRGHRIPSRLSAPRHAAQCAYAVLAPVSRCYPPVCGRFPTRYSPVRHWALPPSLRRVPDACPVRLACVRHAASVHPEPGSNSRLDFYPFRGYPAPSLWAALTPLGSFVSFDSGHKISLGFLFRIPHGFPSMGCLLQVVLTFSIEFSKAAARSLLLPAAAACFWNFQGCITVQLSRFRPSCACCPPGPQRRSGIACFSGGRDFSALFRALF